jgi:hypothetical protein
MTSFEVFEFFAEKTENHHKTPSQLSIKPTKLKVDEPLSLV